MAIDKDGKKLPSGITQRADGRYQARFTFNGERITLYDIDLKTIKKKKANMQYELEHGLYGSIKRGQLITSIPEMQEKCSYKIGYRKETPSKKQIFDILEWLRNPYEADSKGTMISTTKVTHGILVTIENYSLYQDIKNYERNNEGNDERLAKVTTGEQYKQECKRMNNIDSTLFETFWKAFPRKTAKAAAKKSFDKLKVNEELLQQILIALEIQEQSKQWQDITYIPYPATWLNQKRWEDEADHTATSEHISMTADGTFKI